MPRFQPFTGLRYALDAAPPDLFIAPPYDIVDEDERARLAARSEYNAIHVELPRPDPASGQDAYEHAASILASWCETGALRAEETPCLYGYRMRYVDELGTERSTLGVIGALEMDVRGEGSVLPHERTMPKPKGDRLDLLRATGINTSPIWALSLAEGLARACAAATEGLPAVRATDDDGVVHELVPISDARAIGSICDLVASTPAVIADVHHRYETATFYREEVRTANGDRAGAHDLVMALVVELTPAELLVQPIHRLLSGLPEDFDLLGPLATWFDLRPAPSSPEELTLAMQDAHALALVERGRSTLLVPRPEVEAAAEADLDSCRLDVALAKLPTHDLDYHHGARNVIEMVEQGAAQAAVLLRPATVPQIANTAHSGHRMPPKTTFFYPKPRTGLVYRSAAGDTIE